MAWGSPWLIPAALGLWDRGLQMAPPPKRTEGGKKRAAKARNSRTPPAVRHHCSRNQGWGPSLSLPISPVFCIEYPCPAWTGVRELLRVFSFDLFPFRAGAEEDERLISGRVAVAFLFDLLAALPRPTTFFNIGMQQMQFCLSSQLLPFKCPSCLPNTAPAHTASGHHRVLGFFSPMSQAGVSRQIADSRAQATQWFAPRDCRFDNDRPQLHRFAVQSMRLSGRAVELAFR